MEGYLFPDTYFFEADYSAEQIVSVMARQMEKVLADYRNLAAEKDMTLHELLTIASLVEKEAFGDHERDTIAGVIFNRMEIDMLLQFCSSVLYGLMMEKNWLIGFYTGIWKKCILLILISTKDYHRVP